MNPIENLKTSPSKSYTNVTGRERILFVDPKDAKRGTTPPVDYISIQTILDAASGGNLEIEDIYYTNLYNKSINGQLVPGKWYRLLDYQSVNFLNGFSIALSNPTPVDFNFNPREIYQGDEEVLLLQATTESSIAPIGYSETFPQDVIQYNPYVNKLALPLDNYNSATLPNSSIVSGFDLQWDGTNVYFELPTGYPFLFGYKFSIYINFDGGSYYLDQTYASLKPTSSEADFFGSTFKSKIKLEGNLKVVLLDLTYTDYLNYDSNSLYVQSNYAIDESFGYIERRQDTVLNIDVPFDFRGRKYRRFECEIFGNILTTSYVATGNTATDGIYFINETTYTTNSAQGIGAQFKVTVNAGSVSNITILNPGRLYQNGDVFTIDGTAIGGTSGVDDVQINVTNIYSNINYWGIGDVFRGATTTGNYMDFKVFNDNNAINVNWNRLGASFPYSDNNVFIGQCLNCNFDGTCYNNTVAEYFYNSTIKTSFVNNSIQDFNGNVIESGFENNIIDYIFLHNYIGNSFYNNTIYSYFTNNVIGTSFVENFIFESFRYNKVGNEFTNNFVKDGFGFGYSTSQGNTIGNYFTYNTIGKYFYNNVIADGFSGNIIGDYFQLNNVKTSFTGTDFIFAGATHVYNFYNCDIFRASDNGLYLTYFDGTSEQYVSPTS